MVADLNVLEVDAIVVGFYIAHGRVTMDVWFILCGHESERLGE